MALTSSVLQDNTEPGFGIGQIHIGAYFQFPLTCHCCSYDPPSASCEQEFRILILHRIGTDGVSFGKFLNCDNKT